MNSIYTTLRKCLISDRARHVGERVVVGIALIAFAVHLLLIGLRYLDWLPPHSKHLDDFLVNPIAAIYTPFSFILVYEIYLLVFYLPQSITQYIGKQYEIITLIIIRRIFKDIANLELTTDWFNRPWDLQLTCDIGATLVLFLLIILFYRLAQYRSAPVKGQEVQPASLVRFIYLKNIVSLMLVPILLSLAVYSFYSWTQETFFMMNDEKTKIMDVNKVFFENFFSVLVIVEVFLLLLSLTHTDSFSKVVRNSGFVISTILIKTSFSTNGLLSVALILGGVCFGVAILWAHNVFEKTVARAQA